MDGKTLEMIARCRMSLERLEKATTLTPTNPWFMRREAKLLMKRAFALWWNCRRMREDPKDALA